MADKAELGLRVKLSSRNSVTQAGCGKRLLLGAITTGLSIMIVLNVVLVVNFNVHGSCPSMLI